MAELETSLDLTLRQVIPLMQDRILNQSKYFGIPAWKSPTDFWVYQELIHELRPDVIVEIGNHCGGSTLALAHLCDCLGHGRVIGVDICHHNVAALVKSHPRISLVEGDACESFERVVALIQPREQVLIIEDSSHTFANTLAILDTYAPLIKVGGYFIVEDGICNHGLDGGPTPGPFEAIECFVVNNPLFVIDRSREAFVLTWNPKGYLRRVEPEQQKQRRSWADWAQNLAVLRAQYTRAAGVYGMVTDDELHFLQTYARFSYTGTGKIADLGCWLGASAGALARGLNENPRRHRFAQPIDSYDQFVWQQWMTPIAQAIGFPAVFKEGDDFFASAADALSEVAPLVRLLRADLSQEIVVNDRIEFLMVDAMKSWPLANAISRSFLPRLIPGRSLVVQQDFGHYHPVTATNHILMWLLRDWFEPVHSIPNSTSVVFFLRKEITRGDVPRLNPKSLSIKSIESAWQYSLSFINPCTMPAVLQCKLLFLLEQGRCEAAVGVAQELRDSGVLPHGPSAHETLALFRTLSQRPSLTASDRKELARAAELCGLQISI